MSQTDGQNPIVKHTPWIAEYARDIFESAPNDIAWHLFNKPFRQCVNEEIHQVDILYDLFCIHIKHGPM